jgi:hypothetical protein
MVPTPKTERYGTNMMDDLLTLCVVALRQRYQPPASVAGDKNDKSGHTGSSRRHPGSRRRRGRRRGRRSLPPLMMEGPRRLDFAIDFQQLQSTRIFASIDSGLRDLLQLLMHRIQLSQRHLHSFFIPKLGQTFHHCRPLPPHLSSATSRRLPALPVAIRYLPLSRRVKFPREFQSVGA